MTPYSLALFLHLLFVLLASAAAALSTFAIVRLRRARSVGDAIAWGSLVARIVPAFPVAVLGLLGTGAYMTQVRWSWSTPWVDAAAAVLGLLVILGTGVEGSRGRALRRELQAAGMSPRARRLLRDPVAWTAKMITLTLVVAAVFVMTVKPTGALCITAIVVAVVAGAVIAAPAWRAREMPMAEAAAETPV